VEEALLPPEPLWWVTRVAPATGSSRPRFCPHPGLLVVTRGVPRLAKPTQSFEARLRTPAPGKTARRPQALVPLSGKGFPSTAAKFTREALAREDALPRKALGRETPRGVARCRWTCVKAFSSRSVSAGFLAGFLARGSAAHANRARAPRARPATAHDAFSLPPPGPPNPKGECFCHNGTF
jgi:hypothetical protein